MTEVQTEWSYSFKFAIRLYGFTLRNIESISPSFLYSYLFYLFEELERIRSFERQEERVQWL
jgi:hypothetical protein